MHLISTTLTHKIVEPRQRVSGNVPALFLLHGRGADENDLLGLTEYLDDRLLVISPRAPFQFQNSSGYTWFDILDIGKPEPKMFAESYRKLVQFIDDSQKGYSIDPAKIFIGGFSMGTIMSYAIALTFPQNIAGVVANSGLIPEGVDLKFNWDGIKGKPFFIAHGLYDSLIPVTFARRAKELLVKAGAQVSYHEYEMDHQIDEESLNDLMQWLEKHLGSQNQGR